jgi:hypothetical protein
MNYKWLQSLGIDTRWILTWNNLLGAFSPQARGDSERINLMFLPPQPLIAGCVVLLMVNGAERYSEFVADLEPKAPGLCKADVMGVAWRSPANETRLLRHEAQVLLGSDPFWFADGEHALVDLGAGTGVGSLV